MSNKSYQVKTTYRDGVVTYNIIDAPHTQDVDEVFNLYLMSIPNTDEDTASIEMFEMDERTSVAAFNFPTPKHYPAQPLH